MFGKKKLKQEIMMLRREVCELKDRNGQLSCRNNELTDRVTALSTEKEQLITMMDKKAKGATHGTKTSSRKTSN